MKQLLTLLLVIIGFQVQAAVELTDTQKSLLQQIVKDTKLELGRSERSMIENALTGKIEHESRYYVASFECKVQPEGLYQTCSLVVVSRGVVDETESALMLNFHATQKQGSLTVTDILDVETAG